MDNSGIKIIEKHISEWALPKEEILSWLKWESDFDFGEPEEPNEESKPIEKSSELKKVKVVSVD